MNFSNDPIALEQIPRLATVPQTSLSAKYRPMNMLFWLVFFALAAAVMSALRFQPFFTLPEALRDAYSMVMMLDVILAFMAITHHFFADPLKTYSLREQDVSFSSGLIFRKTVSQPILRIQHIELQRGPIERMVGLATLQVFSAGGAMHTLQIPGLAHDTAQQLRQYILEHKDLNTHG